MGDAVPVIGAPGDALGDQMRHHTRRTTAPSTTALLTRVVVPLVLLAATAITASAGTGSAAAVEVGARPLGRALTTAPGNPLANREWGVYMGPGDQAWAPYLASTGSQRDLLAKIALRPKAKWFGA